jgi:glycosyltransferase involved in cell wall biosynthesis
MEPAETHLNIADSVWAEPDGDQLTLELQRVAADPRRADLLERVDRARALIATRYSWDASVKRWEEFIADLEVNVVPLRVAMVSTWNSRCGIAENTRYIVDQSKGSVEFDLFADVGAHVIDPLVEPGTVRTWESRWTPDLGELGDALRLTEAEVVHFQFNFGFFELHRMAALIERELEQRGVVVTLHRTRDIVVDGESLSLGQIRSTLEKVDRLIVHQASDVRYLAELGLSANVTLIPVGASPPPDVSPSQARRALKLGSRPVVGTFGFLLPHKGTLELVRAVDALRAEFPDILLLGLCARYPAAESDEYEREIRQEIAARGMEDNVLLITDYLPDDTARAMLRAVDAIVLPYRETGESSSAALRFVLPLGRAVVVTDEPIFADARDAVMVIDGTAPSGIEDALRRVLHDQELQDQLARRSAALAYRFRWPRVVADHREIYLSAKRAGAGRRQDAQVGVASRMN